MFRTFSFTIFILFFSFQGITQKKPIKIVQKKDTVQNKIDSLFIGDIKEQVADNIPIISLDDNDLADASSQNISSVLTAGRDPFFNAASYNFTAARFKIRGYDGDLFSSYMNGIPMENLDNGFTPFGLWGGLNNVMRNKDVAVGLRYNTFAFGDLGSTTNIDSRASKQRKQTEFGYAFSNRNYNHKFDITYNSGINKKGWAFTVSASRRYADEGYVPGTYYDGWSYFIGVDKRVRQKHLLSLVAFGSPTQNGKQAATTAESQDLAGTNYYNPYWGYQNGKKRNAYVAKSHQPVFIFTHDYRITNKTSLVSAVGFSFGKRGSTTLDWYNIADPRPDYYRYLPSYYNDDPAIHDAVEAKWRTSENTRQINWTNLYEANRGNLENFNGTIGKRSRYLVGEYVTNTTRFNFNSVVNTQINQQIQLTAGASYQWQKNNYYKQVNDLLGGDYFVDLNQFAERAYPTDPNANQNDLNRPNRIVNAGDKYGYDYDINISKIATWAQTVIKFKKVDFFIAAELSNTQFYRNGNVKNGLFPNNSYGKSVNNSFTNYAFKVGITYKLDGRNYFFADVAVLTRAPYFDNVYISPKTRDIQQNNISNESIQSIEGGYVLNAPKLKVRIGGYYTSFNNQLNVMSFYHDTYQNFVNYALSGINKVHFGGEFGVEAKLTSTLTLNAAAALGRFYYSSKQNATVSLDNTSSILSVDTVYAQNYRLGGTPQEAYSIGLTYRSPKFWFVSITGNYFDQMWLEINPLRRTNAAVKDVTYQSNEWNTIINQQQFNAQYTVDFFGGYSWKLPKSYGLKKNTFLVFSAGVSNLLNNQNIRTGGFEQLRFDFATHNPDKFPPKYYYSYGLNFFCSATLRF
jgi:hypothetical protein